MQQTDVRWSGRSRAGLVLRPDDAYLIPLSLIWSAGATAATVAMVRGPTTGGPAFIWWIVFCIVGAYLLVGRFVVDVVRRSGLRYELTATEAIVTTRAGATRSVLVNGLGAIATGGTLCVVLVAKFTSGAWLSALLIVLMLTTMMWVQRHYQSVRAELAASSPINVKAIAPPIVIIPIQEWGKVARRGLEFALTLSEDVRAVHVVSEDEPNSLAEQWHRLVEAPLRKENCVLPRLETLESPYRLILTPILDYVVKTARENPERQIAVIVPELVEKHWYHYPLHNQRAEILKARLLLHGGQQIVLVNVPWYLES